MTFIGDIDKLVPHSGRMSLLDRVVGHGNGWLQAEVEIKPDSMFTDSHGVPAWIGLEYMAQTIAAYSGLQERRNDCKPKIGLLLGSRKYTSNKPYFAIGETLSIRVELQIDADNGLLAFDCELRGSDVCAHATVNVFQPDDVDSFIQGQAE